MREKLDRYEAFFQSGIIALEAWQNPERIMFPHVLILSDTRYGLPSFPFKVFQAPTFTAFIRSITKPKEKQSSAYKKSSHPRRIGRGLLLFKRLMFEITVGNYFEILVFEFFPV
ncbi:hypothetical protein ACWKSR_10515, partial [Campylobacter fetus subsp. venerealis]